jgi:hypothetical protein
MRPLDWLVVVAYIGWAVIAAFVARRAPTKWTGICSQTVHCRGGPLACR